jgi:hypothetical protein
LPDYFRSHPINLLDLEEGLQKEMNSGKGREIQDTVEGD